MNPLKTLMMVMQPRVRLWMAWGLLAITTVGTPVSMLTVARDEPPFILFLSWFAVWITAYDVICTSIVAVKQDEE